MRFNHNEGNTITGCIRVETYISDKYQQKKITCDITQQ